MDLGQLRDGLHVIGLRRREHREEVRADRTEHRDRRGHRGGLVDGARRGHRRGLGGIQHAVLTENIRNHQEFTHN